MSLRILFPVFLLALALSFAVAAQEPRPLPKIVSGGVVNGKATSLVKPVYPAAARAVGAEGAVNVQVTIDEEGNVVSATAVSGHPLLRAASVEAAQASKFSPTLVAGQPVKVTGVIVYNFSGPPPSPEQAGFRLGAATGSLDQTSVGVDYRSADVLRLMPADWIAERESATKLQTSFNAIGAAVAPRTETTERATAGTMTMSVTNVAVTPRQPTSDFAAEARQLAALLDGRFAATPSAYWSLRAGRAFSLSMAGMLNKAPELTARGAADLRAAAATLPEGASVTRDDLEKVADIVSNGSPSDADRALIADVYRRLSGTSIR